MQQLPPPSFSRLLLLLMLQVHPPQPLLLLSCCCCRSTRSCAQKSRSKRGKGQPGGWSKSGGESEGQSEGRDDEEAFQEKKVLSVSPKTVQGRHTTQLRNHLRKWCKFINFFQV